MGQKALLCCKLHPDLACVRNLPLDVDVPLLLHHLPEEGLEEAGLAAPDLHRAMKCLKGERRNALPQRTAG